MFGFGIDKRTLYIILAVFGVITIMSWGTAGILSFLLSLPAVIIALTFHEFAHAYAADKLGDDTPRMQGRLNLNPLSHIDWFGLITLAIFHFGWGKPVQVNRRNFSNKKISNSGAEAIVAIAGPIMNFIVAFVFTILFFILLTFAPSFLLALKGTVYTIILNIILINISLGIFNLIPIPPLDGSKVLIHFLPYNGKRWFEDNQYTFYIVLLFLVFIRINGVSLISQLLNPVISGIFSGMSWIVTSVINLFV